MFWQHQRTAYDLLLKTAWATLSSFGRRDPSLMGQIGAHAVLHVTIQGSERAAARIHA
jgi:hypothetical protein